MRPPVRRPPVLLAHSVGPCGALLVLHPTRRAASSATRNGQWVTLDPPPELDCPALLELRAESGEVRDSSRVRQEGRLRDRPEVATPIERTAESSGDDEPARQHDTSEIPARDSAAQRAK